MVDSRCACWSNCFESEPVFNTIAFRLTQSLTLSSTNLRKLSHYISHSHISHINLNGGFLTFSNNLPDEEIVCRGHQPQHFSHSDQGIGKTLMHTNDV